MTTIRLSFPAGRYHATPWGRHVNEGVAEWPPSPYRFLRALYDVWQRKCYEMSAEEVRGVLEALATSPPRFKHPQATATHTRSYLSANSKDPTDKNLVFDAFLVFNRPQACYLYWPDLELTATHRQILGRLLRNLNYLGRSESWVDAELWDGSTEGPFECAAAEAATGECELEKVACVIPPGEYSGKRSWMEALTFSTATLQKEKASAPPLLRYVRYAVPERAIVVDPPRGLTRRRLDIQAVVLGLHGTVLPLATAALEVAEQVRVRLMGAHKKRQGNDESKVSTLFSGKGRDGDKRLDQGHVYILPRGNGNGRIDRILIVSPLEAFDESELDAVRGVRELYQRDGRPSVRCVLTWQGGLQSPDQFTCARIVTSATPFVTPRHWRKGRDPQKFIEDEVRRECRNHRIAATVTRVEGVEMPGPFHASEYRRNRRDDPVRPGYALRLTFEAEVRAPFAIGYGAHFGLGQFAAAGL
jgi:CRISPR-associated protein Csb2